MKKIRLVSSALIIVAFGLLSAEQTEESTKNFYANNRSARRK